MIRLLSIILFFAFSVSLANAHTEDLTRSVALGKLKNFKPVGYVDVVNIDDGGMHEGTATHIGNGILVTAAHTLESLFPKVIPKSGPVVIDVSKRRVLWSNAQSSLDIDDVREYRATKIVVDARFIRNYKPGNLTQDAIDYDIAFIQLDRIPETGKIPLVPNLKTLPDYGVLVGYGSLMFSIKHAYSQTIGLRDSLERSREVISDVERFDIGDYVSSQRNRKKSCDVILGRQCEYYDIFSFESSPGDSGGPLLVNIDGRSYIIAVLSYGSKEETSSKNFVYDNPNTAVNETEFFEKSGPYLIGSPVSRQDPIITSTVNGYVSILSGRPGNFYMQKDVFNLLRALKN